MSEPLAEIEGAAWFATHEEAEAWARNEITFSASWRTIDFHNGCVIETSPYSGKAYNADGEEVEL